MGAIARLLGVTAAAAVIGGIIGWLVGWLLGSVGGRFEPENVWPVTLLIGLSLGPVLAIMVMLGRRGRTG